VSLIFGRRCGRYSRLFPGIRGHSVVVSVVGVIVAALVLRLLFRLFAGCCHRHAAVVPWLSLFFTWFYGVIS